jgi:hypothetical protein
MGKSFTPISTCMLALLVATTLTGCAAFEGPSWVSKKARLVGGKNIAVSTASVEGLDITIGSEVISCEKNVSGSGEIKGSAANIVGGDAEVISVGGCKLANSPGCHVEGVYENGKKEEVTLFETLLISGEGELVWSGKTGQRGEAADLFTGNLELKKTKKIITSLKLVEEKETEPCPPSLVKKIISLTGSVVSLVYDEEPVGSGKFSRMVPTGETAVVVLNFPLSAQEVEKWNPGNAKYEVAKVEMKAGSETAGLSGLIRRETAMKEPVGFIKG